MPNWLKIVLVVGAAALIVFFFFLRGPGDDGPQPGDEKQAIKLFDGQWQTLWINNAIARFIIEKGYGYPVETVTMTTPVMQKSLPDGEIDLNMELWRVNIIDWYNRVIEAGDVVDLGPTFDRSTQGWYVPRYVIEGDAERGIDALAPDLRSVFDLERYESVFPDPEDAEKGLFVNCITGWQCAEINRVKLHAYGLADDYNIEQPGAAAALDSAIAGAFQRSEPVLAYYWEPTWLVGTYDLVQLEEPEFTEECNAEIQRVLTGEITAQEASERAGCAYQSYAVRKGVHRSLPERAPDVAAFLREMNVGTDALNRVSAAMENQGLEADKAALWFFERYEDKWRGWLPADVEQRVADALGEAGAELSGGP